MGMHMGMGGWGLMRSMRRDESMKQHRLTKGMVRRIAGFARPYRGALAVFLVLIVIDAVVGAVNPLIYRSIIDDGILGHNVNLVAVLAGCGGRRWPSSTPSSVSASAGSRRASAKD